MRFLLYLLVFLLLPASGSAQLTGRRAASRSLDEMIRWNPVFSEGQTGFSLCDLNTGNQVYGYNAERYFVPASNVKLLTFYVAQHLLGDSGPALFYRTSGNTTTVWGTGYPLLLHPAFYGFDDLAPWLATRAGALVYEAPAAQAPPRYGAGWSWDDYNYGYVYERSSLPVYGNRLYLDVLEDAGLFGSPPGVTADLIQDVSQERAINRTEGSNQFTIGRNFYYPGNFPLQRPLSVSPDLAGRQLAAAFPNLSVSVGTAAAPARGTLDEVRASLPDTLYRKLLQDSDNYLAEQLLIMAASDRYGWPDEETFFDYAVDTLFRELQLGDLRYADGSGLSRYNLVKPRQLTQLLMSLDREVGRDRLITLLPAGGESGTLKRRFGNRPVTYVWAKTGTLSGVTCVSGIVRCRSGRWLSFSFLHNNVIGRTADYYREMERVLGWVYDTL
ncbi:D-alanyl-D-alanine carboxypeptidase/D-alanyl-D-alanine-endopeptidase [Lewinella sp. IMCC34183]|uniref:D-alanyl-D-alanine carboxypeptidase/D-alanyl-D-alanine-endopeptidase n=1 Tax=Lewinella sp. IMCC34183 TaxID=2248762 RepID=UPI000E244AD3|nr:D-alanyl-D-alanine carboxypeptidase [Lewinella sp. IMCC34183]